MSAKIPEFNPQDHGVVHIASRLLPEGADIPRLDWEQPHPLLQHEPWNAGFGQLEMPGLTYQGCRFAVNHFFYARRGDPNDLVKSRAQAVVSVWQVNPGDPDASAYLADGCKKITAFYPVYDGIGFWIAKRAREAKDTPPYYTPIQQEAMLRVAALGALGVRDDYGTPQSPGHRIDRSILTMGRLLGEDGQPRGSVLTDIMAGVGLGVMETAWPLADGGVRRNRLFGDSRMMNADGVIVALPYDDTLTSRLHPAVDYVMSTRAAHPPSTPPDGSY